MNRKTKISEVLAVLEEGPCTAPEMVASTGLPLKHCSAYLCYLVREGKAKVTGKLPSSDACAHCGRKSTGRGASIYALVAA